MKIKNFEQFLNEWNLSDHWNERSSMKDFKMSRILPREKNAPYGWDLVSFTELVDGKLSRSTYNAEDFMARVSFTQEEIEERITKALDIYLHSRSVQNKKYQKQHVFVNMGSLALEVDFMSKDPQGKSISSKRIFVPTFSFIDPKKKIKSTGNIIWGIVKRNNGVTFYMEKHMDENELKRRCVGDKIDVYDHYDDRFYLDQFFQYATLNGEKFYLIVPSDNDWERAVTNSANSGTIWKREEEKDLNIDKDYLRWKGIMLQDTVTVFDSGTNIVVNKQEIQEVKTTENGKKVTKKFLVDTDEIEVCKVTVVDPLRENYGYENPSGARLNKKFKKEGLYHVVVKNDPKIRELGQLPAEGLLVKIISFNTLRTVKDDKGKARNAIAGPIKDYYVLNGTEKIFSPLGK